MTPKAFVYLAIAAALSVLFAIVSYASNNQWSTGRAAGDKLFSALVSEASQVATIEVKQGDEVAVLERKGGSWSLKSRDGYPADPVKVRTLLVGLAEAELIESKTRRPDRYGVLELEDPAEKGAKSRLVRLLGAQGNVIGEAVIGKKRVEILGTGKGGTYVRKPGDPQTWLANAELDAPLAAKDWVKTSVLTLDASNFSRVTIEIPGEEALKIERQTAAPPKKEAKEARRPRRSRLPLLRASSSSSASRPTARSSRMQRPPSRWPARSPPSIWRTCASSPRPLAARVSARSRSSRPTRRP